MRCRQSSVHVTVSDEGDTAAQQLVVVLYFVTARDAEAAQPRGRRELVVERQSPVHVSKTVDDANRAVHLSPESSLVIVQQAQHVALEQRARADPGVVAPLNHGFESGRPDGDLIPSLVVEARHVARRMNVYALYVGSVIGIDARAPKLAISQDRRVLRNRLEIPVHGYRIQSSIGVRRFGDPEHELVRL